MNQASSKFLIAISLFLVHLVHSYGCILNDYNKNSALRITAPSGLNMRNKPQLGASVITVIPYNTVVRCLSSDVIGEHTNFNQTVYYEDTDETVIEKFEEKYALNVGGNFGFWVKVLFEGKEGWVFSSWTTSDLESEVINVEYLNELPNKFLVLDSPAQNLNYDCFGGIEMLDIDIINRFGTEPVILHILGQESEGYKIKSVEKVDSKTFIVKSEYNDPDQGKIRTVNLKFRKLNKGLYKIEGIGLGKQFLVPIQAFKGSISSNCLREP